MQTPSEQFTEKVMIEVRAEFLKKQEKALFLEKLINSTALRISLSITATICTIWNLLRVYLVLLTPVICK